MTVSWFAASTPTEQSRLSAAWSGAPIENVELVQMILDVAQAQVIAFAGPTIAADPTAMTRLVYAQLEQAKTLWNAGRATPSGDVGTEGFSFTPRPLDKNIQKIIRPSGGLSIG